MSYDIVVLTVICRVLWM